MTSISDTALRPAERPRISVVVPYPPSLTETFIRAHAERLPAEVVLVHGWRPSVGSRPILSMPRIAFYKTLRVLTRSGLERETDGCLPEGVPTPWHRRGIGRVW